MRVVLVAETVVDVPVAEVPVLVAVVLAAAVVATVRRRKQSAPASTPELDAGPLELGPVPAAIEIVVV